jgi:hypothetical protein
MLSFLFFLGYRQRNLYDHMGCWMPWKGFVCRGESYIATEVSWQSMNFRWSEEKTGSALRFWVIFLCSLIIMKSTVRMMIFRFYKLRQCLSVNHWDSQLHRNWFSYSYCVHTVTDGDHSIKHGWLRSNPLLNYNIKLH